VFSKGHDRVCEVKNTVSAKPCPFEDFGLKRLCILKLIKALVLVDIISYIHNTFVVTAFTVHSSTCSSSGHTYLRFPSVLLQILLSYICMSVEVFMELQQVALFLFLCKNAPL